MTAGFTADTAAVSADTDDLDEFVVHGKRLHDQLRSTWETLARQRNYLLHAGFASVVEHSEIGALRDTIEDMAGLDRFVGDLATELKDHGTDLGRGQFEAPSANDVARSMIGAHRLPLSPRRSGTRVSVDRLALDVYYGRYPSELVDGDALDAALRVGLGEDDYDRLRSELAEREHQELLANLSLLTDANGNRREVVVDGDHTELERSARRLYDDSRRTYGRQRTARLDEPELAYRLQQIAETDPGRAVVAKLFLDRLLTPTERAELDRVLATDGRFVERLALAISHPRDGLTGAAKGAFNDNVGWWADWWADATVTLTNGLYGMASNQTGSAYGARVPETWDGNAAIVELEFELDNLAQRGGADAVVAVELATALTGVGKAGLSLVRIGRRYFLRSGNRVVAEVGQDLATKLDETIEVAPANPTPTGDDVITVPLTNREGVVAPGRFGHALDGNINGMNLASGGHYIRSKNVRLTRIYGVDGNGVVLAESQVRGRNGRWMPKLDAKRNPARTTFFPRHWSRRQTMMEIDAAFKNSVPEFTEAALPHWAAPSPPMRWSGRTPSGVLVTGRYKVPGEPGHGWSSVYPVFERG